MAMMKSNSNKLKCKVCTNDNWKLERLILCVLKCDKCASEIKLKIEQYNTIKSLNENKKEFDVIKLDKDYFENEIRRLK